MNYRHVSVLPGVSKFLERLIHKETSFYNDQFMFPYKCGFRKNFSTQHAPLSLIKDVKKMLNNKGYGRAILIDLLNACDAINHDLLIPKLHVHNFSKRSWKQKRSI